MNELLRDAAMRAASYLEGLDARKVAPDPDAVARLDALDTPLPGRRLRSGARDRASRSLRLAGDDGDGRPALLRLRDRRRVAGDARGELARAARGIRTRRSTTSTPATSRLEQIALRWLVELLGLAARNRRRVRDRRDGRELHRARRGAARRARARRLERRGGRIVRRAADHGVVGEEVHPSLVKSLGLLGLGRNRVVRVPVDGQGRMRADALPRIATADDRLHAGRQREHRRVRSDRRDLRARRRQRRVGARRWRVRLVGARRRQSSQRSMRGIERADSWATDAHKWLNVPYDCGLAFVRDADALRAAMAITADYLPTRVAVPQSRRLHAGIVAPRARRRSLGRVALARPRRRRRADRAQLPPGAPFRRRLARGRLSRSSTRSC